MNDELVPVKDFDFDAHASAAFARFQKLRLNYELLAEVAKRILNDTLRVANIRFHSIEARAKSLESFSKKAAKPSEIDPNKPKYQDPLKEITDLTGVRVITFLPRSVEQVCDHVE